MAIRDKLGVKYFFMGIMLIMLIFFVLLWLSQDNMEWSLAYLLVVIYLLWLGGRGKYYVVLGAMSTVAIVLSYFLSTDLEDRGLSTFSASLIAIFSIWMVIYFTFRQKKMLDRELKEKRRLDAMFENATEGILMVSQAGEILMINRYGEQLFGYSREELIGKNIEKLIPGRFAVQHQHHREQYQKDPHNRPMGVGRELFALKKDGDEFPVEISLGFFRSEEEIIVIAFVLDITERKKAIKQLNKEKERTQKLNQELELGVEERTKDLEIALKRLEESNGHLRQMEVDLIKALEKERELGELKSRFVTMASHEFRTPLSTILSSGFLLENYSGPQYEEAKMTHLNRIKRAVKNMTAILNDFLSLSKLEEGKVKVSYADTDIPTSIEEIIDEMEPIKKDGQKIYFSHSGETNVLQFDKQFLRNILINLISNAIKFSQKGDTIEVTSTITSDELKLSVTDHGIGIPEEEQRHLFKRFFRANNATHIEGTGLGLNIVKKYVDLMKGSVRFNSISGQGTKFEVTIPTLDQHQLSESS